MKKSLEEIANPFNNNESLIGELNDQLKYQLNIDKHLPWYEELVTISNRKKWSSSETRNYLLRSPNRFQILSSANSDITVISW